MSKYTVNQSGLAKTAVTGWAWNFVLQISTITLSGAIFLFSSRYLAPQEFGIVAFAAATVALISAVMPTAFGQALVQRENLEERHLQSVFWLCIGFAVIAYVALLAAAPLVSRYQDTPLLTPIIAVLGSKLIFDALNTVPNAILQRHMSFRTLTLRSVIANIIAAVFCFTLIYLGEPLWGLVLSQAINPLVSTIILYGVTRWYPRGLADVESLNELRNFGIYVLGGQILNQARIDQILLGTWIGPIGLGLYYFAHRLYSLCLDLTGGAFSAVSNSVFSALQTDAERQKAAFMAASFASTSIGFPIFAGLMVIAPTAVPLFFGAQWNDAIILVQALSIIGLMATLGVIQGSMLTYLGHAAWWFKYQFWSQAFGWALIVALAPFGVAIVVCALALRTVVIWPFSVWKTALVLDVKLGEYVGAFVAPAVGSAAMVVWALTVPWFVDAKLPWVILALQIALGGFIYGASLVILSRSKMREAMRYLRNSRRNKL